MKVMWLMAKIWIYSDLRRQRRVVFGYLFKLRIYLASGVRLLCSLTNQKFSYFLLIFTKLCGKLLPDGANDNYRCHLMKRNC